MHAEHTLIVRILFFVQIKKNASLSDVFQNDHSHLGQLILQFVRIFLIVAVLDSRNYFDKTVQLLAKINPSEAEISALRNVVMVSAKKKKITVLVHKIVPTKILFQILEELYLNDVHKQRNVLDVSPVQRDNAALVKGARFSMKEKTAVHDSKSFPGSVLFLDVETFEGKGNFVVPPAETVSVKVTKTNVIAQKIVTFLKLKKQSEQ